MKAASESVAHYHNEERAMVFQIRRRHYVLYTSKLFPQHLMGFMLWSVYHTDVFLLFWKHDFHKIRGFHFFFPFVCRDATGLCLGVLLVVCGGSSLWSSSPPTRLTWLLSWLWRGWFLPLKVQRTWLNRRRLPMALWTPAPLKSSLGWEVPCQHVWCIAPKSVKTHRTDALNKTIISRPHQQQFSSLPLSIAALENRLVWQNVDVHAQRRALCVCENHSRGGAQGS